MGHWTTKVKEKINSFETRIEQSEASIKDSIENCNKSASKLNQEIANIETRVTDTTTPIINAVELEFADLKKTKTEEIQDYIDEKLQEAEKIFRAQKIQTGKDIEKLKQEYVKAKNEHRTKASSLIKRIPRSFASG
jgi:hypothetical protein